MAILQKKTRMPFFSSYNPTVGAECGPDTNQ
jgi:hypothetical protein